MPATLSSVHLSLGILGVTVRDQQDKPLHRNLQLEQRGGDIITWAAKPPWTEPYLNSPHNVVARFDNFKHNAEPVGALDLVVIVDKTHVPNLQVEVALGMLLFRKGQQRGKPNLLPVASPLVEQLITVSRACSEVTQLRVLRLDPHRL